MGFINALENKLNVSYTENGMKGYKTTKNTLVDFNFALPKLRFSENANLELTVKSLFNDKNMKVSVLLRYMFFLRDVREGLGERRIFRAMLKELANKYPFIAKGFIPYVAEYGRWDDLFILAETPLKMDMFDYINNRMQEDYYLMKSGQPISLLAKWMPSVNSGKNSRKLALDFIKAIDGHSSYYRKALSKMRKYLDIVERHISDNDYETIKYESVPSKANKRYAELFLRKDYKRRREFLDSLTKGMVKINASVLYPHEIISQLREGYYKENIDLCNGLWKNLKEYDGAENTLVVADVSGSMTCSYGTFTPMDCSIGLGVYFAQRAKTEAFKNKIMTFSSNPTLVDISMFDNITDTYRWICNKMDWGGCTDIEKTFEVVLKVAIENGLKQEEIPNILIISDMEFDYCTNCGNFEGIKRKYAENGYKLPKLIFWNVASRSGAIPCIKNELGVILVSGYSPAALKAALGGAYDPMQAILDCIMTRRYDFVDKVLIEVMK